MAESQPRIPFPVGPPLGSRRSGSPWNRPTWTAWPQPKGQAPQTEDKGFIFVTQCVTSFLPFTNLF